MSFRIFWISALLIVSLSAACRASEESTPLVLISLDGFRFDYIEKHDAKNIQAIAQQGVRAERMQPSYPSKTFPNHITLVTGMYPSRHGLVHNSFYDPDLKDVYKMGKAKQQPLWLQGTPIWIYAEKNNLRSATYFWPESDAKIDGLLPSYYFPYNKSTPYQDRIDEMIRWLKLPEEQRPRFVTGYFSLVDSKGHDFGPNSPQVKRSVKIVDEFIGQLKRRIDTELDMDVNLVLVSDHGMAKVDTRKKINWEVLKGTEGFKVINGSTQLMLYAKEGVGNQDIVNTVNSLNQQSRGKFEAFAKDQLPAKLHYQGNARIADIIVETHPPFMFSDARHLRNKTNGMHGYDPYKFPEMGAIFIANGPAFKQGLTIPSFENIHVFPLLATVLGIPIPQNIDGRVEVLEPILK